MIRAVFFDLDDTLVDAVNAHKRANRETFREFGMDYEEAKHLSRDQELKGMKVGDILKVRKEALGISEKQLPLMNLVNKREAKFMNLVKEEATLLPGAREAIISIRENTDIIAIVSSGTKNYINYCIKEFGLTEFIDYIVGSEDVQKGKPDPECYNLAYSMLPGSLNIHKSECLVVEDSIKGIAAAKQAQMKTLFISSRPDTETIGADFVLPSLVNFNIEILKG